jgi:hypothetical protein
MKMRGGGAFNLDIEDIVQDRSISGHDLATCRIKRVYFTLIREYGSKISF